MAQTEEEIRSTLREREDTKGEVTYLKRKSEEITLRIPLQAGLTMY
jgi:hypothetical protein